MNSYTPEKWTWTDADFERMGWHDVLLHAFAFDAYTLSLDIDYLFHWVRPAPAETYYKFWLSPSTLVFDDVSELRIDLAPQGAPVVMEVTRSEPAPLPKGVIAWRWLLECNEGEISFRSTGYRQFTRRQPELSSAQWLPLGTRGGISFAQVTPESVVA